VWKRITSAEYDQLCAAGFDVLLNFEYAATDWLGGSSAGAAHAAAAVAEAKALGYPAGCAIPGSADFNMTRAQWDTSGAAYARAYRDGIRSGGYTPGVYGPWDVLGWCQQLGGFGMFWQAGMSTAWSGGRNAQPWPGAHLRQRGHITIGGIDCDYNDVLEASYGQAGGDMALSDDDKTWLLDNLKGGKSGLTTDQLQQWLGDGIDGRDGTEVAPRPSLKLVLDKLAGLPAADPAAVAGLLTPEQIAAGLTAAGITPEAVADALAQHFHVS
jgi:hypothetical protein